MILWDHRVLNLVKCYFLIINKDIVNESIEIGKKILYGEAQENFLVIKIDKDLNFQSRTMLIIKTANQKVSAFFQFSELLKKNWLISKITVDFKKKVTFNFFIKGQFSYGF